MSSGAGASPGLAFPRETFAKLTPGPFLHAHLKQPSAVRPNNRAPDEFRKPVINIGSLTHSNGSAVVRCGDTAMVCGVRAEVLLASDIPHPPKEDVEEESLIEELGLVVPNLELSTGCSAAHLPGNPPGTLAQSVSYRILSLLRTSNLINPADLKIQYTEPQTDDTLPDEGPKTVTKAYWTLYVDILCIALDGNPFDTAWAAVIAALQNTVLPKAWWDPDRLMILCSPSRGESKALRLNSLPLAATFAAFSTASPLKNNSAADSWVLADPDTFEEDVSKESLTVVITTDAAGRSSILRIETSGGSVIGKDQIRECIRMAERRWSEWEAVLRGG